MRKIEVRLLGELAPEAGRRSLTIRWEEGLTLERLVFRIAEAEPRLRRWLLDEKDQINPSVMASLGGVVYDPHWEGSTLVPPEQEVLLLLAMEGG